MKSIHITFILIFCIFVYGCKTKSTFELISSEDSGIEFNNQINIINANKVSNQFLTDVLIIQFNEKFELNRTIEAEKIDITTFNWNQSTTDLLNISSK